jgi:hypothetical protein
MSDTLWVFAKGKWRLVMFYSGGYFDVNSREFISFFEVEA